MSTTNRASAVEGYSNFTFIRSEDEWEIDLFRFSEGYGWQKQEPLLSSSSDDKGGRNKSSRKADGGALKVIPRNNCVVIPALRQKVTLSAIAEATTNSNIPKEGASTNTDIGTDGTKPRSEPDQASQKSNDRSCVVRRGDCILFINRRRTRAMLFKFRSLEECLSFSDRFIQLNPWSTNTVNAVASASSGRTNSSQRSVQQRDQQEVVSYIARLMHEPDFLQLVHKIENLVANTTDGAKMLKALETRDLANLQLEFGGF